MWDGHMLAGGSRQGTEASSFRAGPPASNDPAASPGQGQERVDAPPALFADTQEEQQLWEELRGHGASLNRALNEALQIDGGPAWRVFQVRCHPLASLLFSLLCCFRVCFFAAQRSLVSVCWWRELELRARDRYGALDQMSAELRHPGAARRSRRPRRGPEDPGWLVGVPGRGSARPTLGARGAAHGARLCR
jgi:hypothetical protein